MTNQEIDHAVVKEVMGLVESWWEGYGPPFDPDEDEILPCLRNTNRDIIYRGKFSPSTSIADAFLVVEKMQDDGWAGFCLIVRKQGLCTEWRVIFEGDTGIKSAIADSVPMAICLAALAAKRR